MNDSIVTDTLDVRVNATFDLPYDSELELNVTTKSTKQTDLEPFSIFPRKTSSAWEHLSTWN